MTYHSLGKQVLNGSQHVADAISPGMATRIAEGLNRTENIERHPDMFSDQPTAACHVRQENDEYACSCGKRWDVADGEEHP